MLPEAMRVKMVRVTFRKTSSTPSPVLALVSKKTKPASGA
jgi:hypothetical protein